MTESRLPFLIVGLGNPGKKYQQNRHNIGFMLLDRLADEFQVNFKRKKAKALLAECLYEGMKLYLVKPQRFMNDSGRSVAQLMRFFKIPESQLLIIYDELDLPTGTIRIRPGGGSGGHRGMRSIIHEIATQDFARMRIGIGRPPGSMDPAEYVLQDFKGDELIDISLAEDRAAKCVKIFLLEGIQAAMNCCNTI
jgi:PTH1 family peptidyl-tRNA hydrolase